MLCKMFFVVFVVFILTSLFFVSKTVTFFYILMRLMAKNDQRLHHAHFQELAIFTQIFLVGFNIIEHLKSYVWNFKSTFTKRSF